MIIDFKNFNVNTLKPKTDFDNEVLLFIKDWYSAEKTVEVQTSGSTGTPKILNIEKARMQNSAQMTCEFLGLKEFCTALLCLPIAFISGKMMVVRAIERKMMLEVITPSLDPLKNLHTKIDFCAITPLQVENSLDKVSLIGNLIIGGAQVSEILKIKILKNLKNTDYNGRIFETFGMSETLSHIALKEIYPKAEEYFTILKGVEIFQDERDCLIIKAPHITSEILKTNDVIELPDDKNFRFLGRTDFVINSGGVKIFPEQLEKFVKNTLAKKGIDIELIFSGKKDSVLGQKLVLLVEGKEEEKIKEAILGIVFKNKFERPKNIEFVQKFPRSDNGKILRKKI